MKRVAILLATYNGARWLTEQLDSLLGQRHVEVTIFVSDDHSSDATLSLLQARDDSRLRLLPQAERFGSAAGNFFRLLRDVDFSGFDAVSLSDQDDVWHADKLARALRQMEAQGVAAVSGNVEAFWPDGRRRLIRKSQPQRRWDHYFEAAGPGCTYVLSAALAQDLQSVLRARGEQMREVSLHDWFIYCYARSHGYRWFIDEQPGMAYRQHGDNVIGANQGWAAARSRVGKILDGWYQGQIMLIARLCDRQEQPPVRWLTGDGRLGYLRMMLAVRHMRRYWRDRCVLTLTFVVFFFRAGWK